MSERGELDKWAANHADRMVIELFLEWCDEQRLEICAWDEDARWPRPIVESRDRLLNRYHEVDEARLEEQRRALLTSR
jgi:hypothetical protein